MILADVFERFITASPLTVMLRVVLEQSLPSDEVDQLFEEYAQKQYHRELLFSSVVNLMSLAVCGIFPSMNAAYQSKNKEIGVCVQAVYDKLKGIEPHLSEILVRYGAQKSRALIEELGARATPLVEGYQGKILDGNHLAATERRLDVLRSANSAPLPGQALVVLEPSLKLATDVFTCEDGHAQERSIFERVLKTVKAWELWIADRNFCTLGFLFGIHMRKACFVIRQHANLPWTGLSKLVLVGKNETGEVFEQSIELVFNNAIKLVLRRVVVQLKNPTRDGDPSIAIVSNLPIEAADGLKIAALYQRRWSIETLFQVLDKCFKGEINTLAYPKAALFGFCMALICHNALTVLRAAMGSAHGSDKIEAGISSYYLSGEIRRVYEGMMIAIPVEQWQDLAQLKVSQTANLLEELAAQIDLSKFRSHPRGKKKKIPKPKYQKNKPHVSTARLLAQAKATKKTSSKN